MDDLTIDREFQSFMPALDDEAEAHLEARLLADGCRDAIIVWANHDDTILDGYHRYRLCKKHGIKFHIKAIKIDSRDEALKWILKNQMGRRNLTQSQRAYYAAQLVNSHVGGDHRASLHDEITAAEVAVESGVSERTVKSVRKVLEEGAKPLKEAVRDGEIAASTAAVIAELPKAEQAKLIGKGPEAVAAKARKMRDKKPAAQKKYKDTFDTAEIEKDKPKPGSEKKTQFKDSTIDDFLGKLIRAVDDRWNLNGGHGNHYRICVAKLREFGHAWGEWRKAK